MQRIITWGIFAGILWLIIPTSWYPFIVLALLQTVSFFIASAMNEQDAIERIPGSKL